MSNNLMTVKQQMQLLSVIAIVVLTGAWVLAVPKATQDGANKREEEKLKTQEQLFQEFAVALTQVTLVGNFTETGKEQQELKNERYEIESVEHVGGEKWLFKARIRYGENDVTLPLTLPVRWAGDTPVICVDNMGFPGLGTYTARVMIYSDHYAGFWTGGDHGGHLFGTIKRGLVDTPQLQSLTP